MAKRRVVRTARPPRNTAPLWKKLTIVAAAAVTAVLVHQWLIDAGGFVRVVVSLAAALAVAWLVGKALGVHMGLHSWD